MHAQFGHPIQIRISEYLKQYKEEQLGLLRMTTPIFQCYSYDAGFRMAHIRRKEMGYKSNYVVQNLYAIICIPADQYLVSISNTGRRHQQRIKLKQDPFFNVTAYKNSFFPSVINA